MTREDAVKLLPIIKAFSEGKTIQHYSNVFHKWDDIADSCFNFDNVSIKEVRIKPTLTHRPFANAEECWEEMKKHQPFGWVKYQNRGICLVGVGEVLYAGANVTYEDAFNDFTFADGSVFGKLTEEG